MRYARSIVICLFVIGGVLQVPLTASANPGLVVEPINGTVTADSLASMLVGDGGGVSVVGDATYTGASNASGTFSGGDGIIGFGSGILLTSGDVGNVVGQNGQNSDDSITANNGEANDLDLDALSGFDTHDASVLEFNFTTDQDTVFFQYVFASDEYNEWVNTPFNDTFGFFVNGTNCATVGGDPITINTINKNTHADLYRNNDPTDFPPGETPIETEMDGLTVVLTCQATVNTTEPNHIKLAIADASDFALDSAVFLKTGSFSTTPPAGFISGKVVNDANGNGADDGEAGLAGAIVRLYSDNTDGEFPPGEFDGSDPQVGGDFTTGTDGTWAFVNLDQGTYWAVETDPSGYISTNAIAGTNATTETADRIRVDLPAESSSTGNKFLDVQASTGTQDFAAVFCPSTGCTVSTDPGGGPTSTDLTVSTLDVPAGVDPQTITLRESSGATSTLCGGGPCQGQILDIRSSADEVFSGISNPKDPVILTMIFDKTVKQGSKVYVDKGDGPQVVKNCTVTGDAAPRPCISEKNILVAGGDRAFIILFLVGDPIIGKR